MKVTVIPTVISVLKTLFKGLVNGQKDLEIIGQVETIQTTALLKRVLRLEETCCHSNSNEKPSANAGVKNSQNNNNDNDNYYYE